MTAVTARNATRTTERGFHPLKWAHRLLSRPLKLKRIGWQWHVVFDQSRMLAPSSKGCSRGEALRLAHEALQMMLTQHDDARHVMPHLSHLEHALARNGSRALMELPEKVLRRAMDQLDSLEGASQSEELLPLRSRVAEALRARKPVNMRGDIAEMDVQEASASAFEEAEVSWTNRMALDEATDRMALDAIYAQAAGDAVTTK